MEMTKKYSLVARNEREIFPIEVIVELLKYLDNVSNTEDGSNELQMIKLYVKLNLVAPAKRNVIAKIKISDFIVKDLLGWH